MILSEIDKRFDPVDFKTQLRKMLRANCMEYLTANKTPAIFRGMGYPSQGKNVYVVRPANFTRTSANTENYYTVWIDNARAWSRYPKRGKSLICSNSIYGASDHGTVFMVIPFDRANIGVCPTHDLWDGFRAGFGTIGIRFCDLSTFNSNLSDLFHDMELRGAGVKPPPKCTYDQFNKSLKGLDVYLKSIKKYQYADTALALINAAKRAGSFTALLTNILNPRLNGFRHATSSTIGKFADELGQPIKELWTDSPCVLIPLDIFGQVDWSSNNEVYAKIRKLVGLR